MRSIVKFSSPLCQIPCAAKSFWAHLRKAPLDGNHATAHACQLDPNPRKVNLSRGVYKDENGKDWKLPAVHEAERRIFERGHGHEYLGFNGLPEFCKSTSDFAFGESSDHIKEGRVATVQAISGTGALRVGAEFLKRFLPFETKVYLSDPTYVNHYPLFQTYFQTLPYTYYDNKECKINFEGFLRDLDAAPDRSIFVLHACAHNPTGMDPTPEQWEQIADLAQKKHHVCFFDSAYQGFASGNPDKDAEAFRKFANRDIQILVAQSYAKNMGLYGQRVGALNVLTHSKEETAIVLSQLNQVIRPMYSNPPAYGARIVHEIFSDSDLRKQWETDVKTMADRIISVRKSLRDYLSELNSHSWDHITKQIGMFSYSGLSEQEVRDLRDHSVYMNLDGRMSMTGVNQKNVQYLAEAIDQVVKKHRGK